MDMSAWAESGFIGKRIGQDWDPVEVPQRQSDRKLNLLIVTSALYLGGVQKVACILASTLAERHNVTLAYCVESDQSNEVSDKCRVHKLSEYAADASIPTKMLVSSRQVRELRELKRELDIDASISLGNTANAINVRSRCNERIICCERSSPKQSWGKNFPLIESSYRKADFVVFQSQEVQELFEDRIREKSCILKNPVPIPPPAHEDREKKIVTMGRLTPQKNHELLIRSFVRFHERFPEYTLHIFGEGPLEEQTRQLVLSLHMEGHVFLEGNDPAVHTRIRDAEMFVLSSVFEGLSNALLEAMSMGIVCISTRCEGSSDVIRDRENGLLVDIGDEEALTQAMCLLAENPELRRTLERQAMEDLKAYDRDIVVSDWERMIEECVGTRGRAAAEGGL